MPDANVATRRCARCATELPDGAFFCPRCGSTTPAAVTGAPEIPPSAVAAERAAATRARLQAALGPAYELGDLIGSGGFADVFAAYDTRLKREVAVKALRVDLMANPDFLERFRREAESIARLRHPHIVSVYAVGEDVAQGVAYFVMPRIRGETLAAALEREPRWSFAETCRILREAAGALAEAHRNGFVHRDVKPENIMLDGPDRRVVIMDFGIAKLADPASPSLTMSGMLVGSPQYMSPEQAVGDATIDHLSDEYSLGLVGYRMLAGRLPFEAETARALLFKQATAAPTPLRDLRPDVPASLARVIERAIAKDRRDRFPSMAEFGDALARVAVEVAGEFRSRRVVPPLAERWTAALSSLYDRPWRWAVAALVGLLVFAVAYPAAESRGARVTAGARTRAVAAGHAFLATLGVAGHYAERTDLVYRRSVHEYLQAALPPDSADQRALDDRVWVWDLSRYRGHPEDAWWVTVNGRGRVTSFNHNQEDSAWAVLVSVDSARAGAERLLERLGWRIGDLRPLRQSTIARVHRTDHAFVWSVRGHTVRRAGDSAFVELHVTMAGDAPIAYGELLRVPEDYVPGWRPATRQVLAGVGLTLLVALAAAALAIALRRGRHDTLQWSMGVRLGGAMAALWFLGQKLPGLRAATVPYWSGDVSRLGMALAYLEESLLDPNLVGPAMFVLVVIVATESLLDESRPDLVAGLSDLSRGRVLEPELVRAVPAGYAYGLCGAAAIALLDAIARHGFGVPTNTSLLGASAIADGAPVLGVVVQLPMAMLATTALAFLAAIALRLRMPWLAPVAAMVLWFCYGFQLRGAAEPRIVIEALAVSTGAWVVQRHGVLATLLAVYLALALPTVADLVLAGRALALSAAAGALLLAAPALAARVVYRRRMVVG